MISGNFPDGTFITISGVTYLVEGGELRKATAAEIAAHHERAAADRAAKDAKKAERQAAHGSAPTLVFGDIAGGDIIKSEVHIRSGGDVSVDVAAILRKFRGEA